MKKLGAVLLVLSLLLSLFPNRAIAAETSTNNLDITTYLKEASTTRGYQVTKDHIELSLALNGKTLEDFKTVDELKIYLGDVIKADSSNLNTIYTQYNIDQKELTNILADYGEELKDYIFINDLDATVAFYNDVNVFEKETDFDTKLTTYLSTVSSERGFEVTVNDINAYLSEYASSIDDFETVDELSEYLGEVIKADLSNLNYFETNYDMDIDALQQFVNKQGKNMNDFVYMDQIEYFMISASSGFDTGLDLSLYKDIFEQLGLTEKELQNLENHFLSITDYMNSAEGQAQMEDLSNRMINFSQALMEKAAVDENYKPNDAEIAEFVSLYNELLTNLKLKLSFSIIKDGVETKYTMEDAIKMQEPIEDADYKLVIYNDQSELLADVVITSQFIKANLGEFIDEISNVVDDESIQKPVQTVKGGKLPKTAGNYIPKTLFGLVMSMAGFLLFLSHRLRTIR